MLGERTCSEVFIRVYSFCYMQKRGFSFSRLSRFLRTSPKPSSPPRSLKDTTGQQDLRDYLLSCYTMQVSFCSTSDRWSDSRHVADVLVLTVHRRKASQKGHVPNGPEVDLEATSEHNFPAFRTTGSPRMFRLRKGGSSLETERNFTNAQRNRKHSL